MNKPEMTFQVRFDKETADNLRLDAGTTILGGELVAIDFQGSRFKNTYSQLNLISVDDGLPEPIDTNHEYRHYSKKLLVRYWDEGYEQYVFDFAWAILSHEDEDIEPDHKTPDGEQFYFELVSGFSEKVKVSHWMYLPDME